MINTNTNNITILDTIYTRSDYKNDTPDYMTIVYKNLDDGKKYHETIEYPEYEYYVLKSNCSKQTKDSIYNENIYYRPINDYDLVTTKYNDLIKSVADSIGESKKFYENIKYGRFSENRAFLKHHTVESTDRNISDFYREKFNNTYNNSSFSITKGFLDIEVDIINSKGSFVEKGECPINAVTVCFHDARQSYTLILRNEANPQIEEFENMCKNGEAHKELFNMIKDSIVNPSIFDFCKFGELEFKFIFFDNEIELIHSIFTLINNIQPDFVLAWNMGFDIPYIIERIKVLGYNPEDIICHPNFENKVCNYRTDPNAMEIKEKTEYAQISAYTVYIDQLIHFASRNAIDYKKYGNWKLETIGTMVGGMSKLSYGDDVYSFKDFPYKNFKRFIYYNIIDVLVQIAIECRSKDIEYVFVKSLANNTRYSAIHRQSIYLSNALRSHLNSIGYFMSTNDKVKSNKKYPGAFVADPLLLNDYSKENVNGEYLPLFRNSFDFDYTALYPSNDIQFNIGHETLIGQIAICDAPHIIENKYVNYQYFDNGARFTQYMTNSDYIGIGNTFLNLPNIQYYYNIFN